MLTADRLAALRPTGGHRTLAEGLDPDDYPTIDAWSRERLGPELGRLFRFGEYIGMNVMRFMVHHVTGGWGLEDAGGAVKEAL